MGAVAAIAFFWSSVPNPAMPEVQHVILIRGYVRALPLRGRGEGGNWTHERKSENLINEHAFRKITKGTIN